MWTDGKKDMTQLIVAACRNFSNAPRNENFSKVTKSSGRELNPRRSEYEDMLSNQLRGSVISLFAF